MLPRLISLSATAALAALAVALPATATAATSNAATSSTAALTLPDTTQLTTALDTIVNPTSASGMARELAPLTAGLTSAVANFSAVITTDLGLSATAAPSTLSPAQSLEWSIANVANLAPANPSAAQQQAVTEFQGALTRAGFSVLVANSTSDGGAAAIAQLAALTSLQPGASTSASGLTAVAAIVSALANQDAGQPDAATLANVAATLNAATPITPAGLAGAISALQSVTSTIPAGSAGATVSQVAQALASQLAQSGSLLGAMSTVGAPLSPLSDLTDTTTALAQLSGLGSLAPGASAPLNTVGSVLGAVAATPGVPGTTAASLSAVAATLSAGTSAVSLQSDATTLKTLSSSLPAPLNSLTLALGNTMAASGAVFATITGLSAGNAASALNELATLAGLGAGASTPALPGLASVLTQIGDDYSLSDPTARTALLDLISVISTDGLTADQLAGASSALSIIAGDLPASIAPVMSQLASTLSADATQMGASSTPAPTPTIAIPAPTSTTATAKRTHPTPRGVVEDYTRKANVVTVTVHCKADRGMRCAETIRLSGAEYRTIAHHIILGANLTRSYTLTLRPLKRTSARTKTKTRRSVTHGPVRLAVTATGYRVVASLR